MKTGVLLFIKCYVCVFICIDHYGLKQIKCLIDCGWIDLLIDLACINVGVQFSGWLY